MFDIGGWELLVAGLVALIVVGPKESYEMLRVVGRYAGMIKRQAGEFRSQLDDAMRDSEFEKVRSEMNEAGQSVMSSVNDAQDEINKDLRDGIDWDDETQVYPDKAKEKAESEFATAREGEDRAEGADVDAELDADPGQVADDGIDAPGEDIPQRSEMAKGGPANDHAVPEPAVNGADVNGAVRGDSTTTKTTEAL